MESPVEGEAFHEQEELPNTFFWTIYFASILKKNVFTYVSDDSKFIFFLIKKFFDKNFG